MKAAALILSILTATLSAGEKLNVLKLTDGTEYKNVEIMGTSAKGLRIVHNSGAATIGVELLPPALKTKYGPAIRDDVEDAATPKVTQPEAKPEMVKPDVPATADPPPAAAPAVVAPAVPPAQDAKAAQKQLPPIFSRKIYGIAEVLADKFKLDGKLIRMDVIVNSASKIESVSADQCRIFVGDPFTKKESDYTFIRFPEAGRKKVDTMLNGARGRMTFYVLVEAAESIPFLVVGRTTVGGSQGKPVTVTW